MLRAYDVTDGSILINGTDIRGVTQHDLRAKIGYVPQKSILFSGTVESNLRLADDHAGEAALRSALATAQAAEFVLDKPEGLALAIGPGGANVSGGQKQRLAIARALVKQPPIYIFDDSFSAWTLRPTRPCAGPSADYERQHAAHCDAAHFNRAECRSNFGNG